MTGIERGRLKFVVPLVSRLELDMEAEIQRRKPKVGVDGTDVRTGGNSDDARVVEDGDF